MKSKNTLKIKIESFSELKKIGVGVMKKKSAKRVALFT